MEIESQNAWVHGYSYEDRPADEVASDWIGENLDIVAGWLEGVEAVRALYQ
ncbi:hypothetical protein [Halomonas sp. KAO]|uniref:hypothetical protein n=1 Tax=Halomonas sp. KAO TaxID=2783858 RepID=UPI001E51E8E2|nr:hypothetical protein [Halomonas sp. KAO]